MMSTLPPRYLKFLKKKKILTLVHVYKMIPQVPKIKSHFLMNVDKSLKAHQYAVKTNSVFSNHMWISILSIS